MDESGKTQNTIDSSDFINHSLIKPDTIEQRLYQLNLAAASLKQSTLVVLPTGLGKTIIALLVIAGRLSKQDGRVLILSPTKPLVEQHAAFLKNAMTLDPEKIVVFTGSTPPAKRSAMWEKAKVVVSTPQVIENDLLSRRIDLSGVIHITFDEAHRAVGNYAYVYIAEKYHSQAADPLVLGITASPGSSTEKIDEVCRNLFISNVQVRTEHEPDVRPYIHYRDIEWRKIDVPVEIQGLKQSLERVLEDRLGQLEGLGFAMQRKMMNKRELLDFQASLQGKLRRGPDQRVYKALSLVAEIMKIGHAAEIAETQGPESLVKYFERLEHEAGSKSGSKASRRIMEDVNVRHVIEVLKEMDIVHPKLEAAKKIVCKQLAGNPDSRVIVFTNYRDTSELVAESLKELDNVRPVRFVGQATKYRDTGLTQKQQVDILDRFRSGEYNTLVATSVAEEGLDIPATDLVLFFEPVPSEIRSIQRKGRTGRHHAGKVVVLAAKGTRDEAYYWSSRRKEKSMNDNIRHFSNAAKISDVEVPEVEKEATQPQAQKDLLDFSKDEIEVYVDQQEVRSGVARALEAAGILITVSPLEVGDYIISDRVAIERKTDVDLLDSIIDKKRNLFGQLSNLVHAYERPVLIIEGDNLYSGRQIHPNAIRGVLASIAMDFRLPIINTRDPEDTAAVIQVMAKREQIEEKRRPGLHGGKSAMTLKEQQEYIVSSISNIGPAAAHKLLRHFKSVENIMKASAAELMEVESIGPKTAQRIREIVGGEYKG